MRKKKAVRDYSLAHGGPPLQFSMEGGEINIGVLKLAR